MTWGVEITSWAFSHMLSRFPGGVFPVNNIIFSGGMFKTFLKKAKCCSTSGFVGERRSTLPFERRDTITSSATIVFPRPVGSTISVDLLIASPARASWYNLCSTVSVFIRG